MGRLPHARVGVEQRPGDVEDLVEPHALAELPELVALGVRELGQLGGGRGLEDEHAAAHLDDVAHEALQILAVPSGAVDRLERRRGVEPEERLR